MSTLVISRDHGKDNRIMSKAMTTYSFDLKMSTSNRHFFDDVTPRNMSIFLSIVTKSRDHLKC